MGLRRSIFFIIIIFYFSDNFEKLRGRLPVGKKKTSHLQFRFVDFWVEVQRDTLSFLEIISLSLLKKVFCFHKTSTILVTHFLKYPNDSENNAIPFLFF